MVVRNVNKVQSRARLPSAVNKPRTTPQDLNANNSDEEDAEAWFHEAVPNTGDQNMNMPPSSTVQALNRDVFPVRETILDRVGRKYKQIINDKKAAAE